MLTRPFSAKHSAGVAESAESVRTSSGDAWVTVSGVVIIRCSPSSVCLGSCGGSPLLRRSRHHDRHPPRQPRPVLPPWPDRGRTGLTPREETNPILHIMHRERYGHGQEIYTNLLSRDISDITVYSMA